MIRAGGSSYSNGIKFSTHKYSVSFESYPNLTKMSLSKEEGTSITSVLDFLSNIPLVRGLVCMIRNSKLVFLILLFDLLSSISLENIESKHESSITIYELLIKLFILIVMLIILVLLLVHLIKKVFNNLKATWQYHGAEHKVILTNNEDKPLTLENCRKASRIADNCGTMLASLFIVVFTIINVVFPLLKISIWVSIRIFIAFVLSYELFLLDRNTPIVRYIFKFGYWLQEHFFTLEPTDLQLTQAIEAFKLLERAETGQIADEELKDLLQNGKEITF